MKELRGSASGVAAVPAQACTDFLLAVDRYPIWHGDVIRRVEVLERDGDSRPTMARALLHVAVGPVVKDFDLTLAITHDGVRMVKLTRVPHHASDPERFEVTWRLDEMGGTRINLDLEATLPVPRLVPIGGIGDHLAQSFVTDATRALGSPGA
jgi:hypothetical protein